MARPSNRKRNEIRSVNIETNVNMHAEGSCIISCGNTKVMCTASFENKVPPFLRGQGKGWVSAEYSMLPRATGTRVQREISNGKHSGRTMEIQRLIARSLRSCIDLEALGERQIIIDCDVLQADGGTRCASITGGFVALKLAINKLMKDRVLRENPIKYNIAAISCGIYKGMSIADIDYTEDSNCEVDMNFVMNDKEEIIEVQGTAEGKTFSFDRLSEMYSLAKEGIQNLIAEQNKVL